MSQLMQINLCLCSYYGDSYRRKSLRYDVDPIKPTIDSLFSIIQIIDYLIQYPFLYTSDVALAISWRDVANGLIRAVLWLQNV